jgi:hypothetical protein
MTSISKDSVQMVQSSGCADTGTAPPRKISSRERSSGILELFEDEMVFFVRSWESRVEVQVAVAVVCDDGRVAEKSIVEL